MNAITVSLCIVCKNEEPHIDSCLNSLLQQTAFSQINEILIVDHGSTDKTLSIINNFQARLKDRSTPLLVFTDIENNLGKSRARLVTLAQSDYVAFIDADCIAPPHWLKELITQYQQLDQQASQVSCLGGIGGPNRLPASSTLNKAINLMMDHPFGHGFSPQAWIPHHPVEVSHLPTTQALFNKAAIMEAGNFSTNFARTGEDSELGLRIRQKGYKLVLLPEPIVINQCSEDIKTWLSRMYRFGKNLVHIHKLHSQAPNPPALYLTGLFLFTLIGPVLLAAFFYPPLVTLLALYPIGIALWSCYWSNKHESITMAPLLTFVTLCTQLSYATGALVALLPGTSEN